MRDFTSPGRSPVHACHGMAATSHTLATETAVAVLRAGGNALDAAIAACALQCVVEPAMTGIGGDCFALYSPGGQGVPLAYNGSGRAPAAATPEALLALGVTSLERGSPHSVVVPGAIDAWARLHTDHGHMPWAELLAPAIEAARQGFPIASRVHHDFMAQREFLLQNPSSAAVFLDGERVPAVGECWRLPALADTLEALAQEGRELFYQGELAADMVDTLQGLGGLHTQDDFARAAGEYVTPISSRFRGRRVYECPPNGQGVIALLLLNLLDDWPGVTQGNRGGEGTGCEQGPMSLARIHHEIEACRLAYRARTGYLADPAQVGVPVDTLLSPDYAQQMRAAIQPTRATVPSPLVPAAAHQDTVYITVVDRDRNACSFINTLFWAFGSGITTPRGITLTNRAMGFSLDPASANCIAPNKRPLHTIIPGMVNDAQGRVELCFGVMGGEYQAMGHQQFLSRKWHFGCDIQEAMDLPRFMVDPYTGEVALEPGVEAATRTALQAMGHTLAETDAPIGGAQAIGIDWEQGVLTGGSDPRKDGCALGY